MAWSHQPFRTDNWLLLRQCGTLLAHGRGDLYTQDGPLVACVGQEALPRFAGRR